MKTVLITGATGDVGTHLSRELAGKYKLRLSDKRILKKTKGETFMRADISKMADALKITKGVDAIVHLGGFSVEGPWEAIHKANIVGCYNIFEAARKNKVKRMLWASNWPHPSVPKEQRPPDEDLLDLLLDWAPDEKVRRKILVDNPAELYGY